MSTDITTSTTLKKTFTDFSAEEAWLNEMSAKGQALVAYRGMSGYTFVAAEPGAWQYAIEILGGKGTTRDNYLSFLKDVGIEVVSIYACRAYLRKKNDGVPFELHSDLKSRLEQAQKGNTPWTSIPLSQVVLALILIISVFSQVPESSSVAKGIVIGMAIILVTVAAIEFFIYGKPYRRRIRELKQAIMIKE